MEALYVVTDVIKPDQETIENLQAENRELKEQMAAMQKKNQDALLEIETLKAGSAVIEQNFSNVVDQLVESGLIKIPVWEPDPDSVYTKEDMDHIEKIVGHPFRAPSYGTGPIKLNQKKETQD